MKWLNFFIFILFTGFLAVGAILQLESVREKVKRLVIEKIESETGYQVKIESIRLFPSFQLTANNISIIQEKNTLIECKHLYIGIYPHELFSGSLHISKLHVEGLKILNLPDSTTYPPINQPSSEAKPFKLRIDDLFIENTTWSLPEIEHPQFPVTLRGNLEIDTACQTYFSGFKFSSPFNPNSWFNGSLALENRSGALLIQKDPAHKISLEIHLATEGLISIPQILLNWEAFSLSGSAAVSPDGSIQNSSINLSIDDLSKFSPLSGSVFGDISISGNIKQPAIKMHLESPAITGFDHTINNVQLNASTLDQGVVDLKFTKNEHPYHFFSVLKTDHSQTGIPSLLDFTISLEEVARLINLDVADINGNLAIHAAFKDNSLQMRFEIQKGLLETFDMGTRFENIHAIIEGNTEQLKLITLTADDTGQGKYQGTGFLNFDSEENFPFSIQMKLIKTKPAQSDLFNTAISGTLAFSGNFSKAHLSGEAVCSFAAA